MFYKNLIFFRVAKQSIDVVDDDVQFERALAAHPAGPVTGFSLQARGWKPVIGDNTDSFTHRIGNAVCFALGGEDRVLPPAAVAVAVARRIEAIEKERGYGLKKRERNEVKDNVMSEIIPRSLVKPYRLDAFIDTERGILAINTSSQSAAEALVSALRKTLGSFIAMPLHSFRVRNILTDMAINPLDQFPFAVGGDAELQSSAGSDSKIRLKNFNLSDPTVRSHIEAMNYVSRLSMYLRGDIEFSLGEDLSLRGVHLMADAMAKMDGMQCESMDDEIRARMWLVTTEIGKLFDELEVKFGIDKLQGADSDGEPK